jgi:hypothetical protein
VLVRIRSSSHDLGVEKQKWAFDPLQLHTQKLL